jgi:hypothetical protein
MIEIVRTELRLPRELQDWIKQQSVANLRSWNAEAVWNLRQRMMRDREQAEQRQAVR